MRLSRCISPFENSDQLKLGPGLLINWEGAVLFLLRLSAEKMVKSRATRDL